MLLIIVKSNGIEKTLKESLNICQESLENVNYY